jgi:hypothetical protein
MLVSKFALAAYHAFKYADNVPRFIALDVLVLMFTVSIKYVYKFENAFASCVYTY